MTVHRGMLPRGLTLLAALGLSLAAPAALSAADVPFLRGDANDDGVITLSDAHFILSFVFRDGAVPVCQKSADVNDDSVINLTDSIRLVTHVFLGGVPPCDPYPEVGADPTADSFLCEAYGNGVPLVDSEAEIVVADATADADGSVTFTVFVSSSRPVAGFGGVFSIGGGVLAGSLPVVNKVFNGSDNGGFRASSVVSGLLSFGSLNNLITTASTGPGAGIRVMRLDVCLAKGTLAGSYPIEPQSGELVDQETGRAIYPRLSASMLTVLADFGPAAGCEPESDPEPATNCQPPQGPPPEPDPGNGVQFLRGDANADGSISISDAVMIRRYLFNGKKAPPCLDAADVDDNGQVQLTDVVLTLTYLLLGGAAPQAPGITLGGDPTVDFLTCRDYTVTTAVPSDDLVRIGSIQGAPGEAVAVPVYLTNTVAVEAYQLVIRYDASLFSPTRGADLIYDGTFYESGTGGSFRTVNPDLEEGVLAVGFIPSLTETKYDTPPGVDRLVFKIPGTIAESAIPGATLELVPTNGADGAGMGPNHLRNELTHEGDARYASILPRLEGGLIGIVGDQTFFRGDANDDGRLDISDPVRTLGALFLGAGPLLCEDAADANDDGKIDISDAATTLEMLFLGGPGLPPPNDSGRDPTPDSLRCRRE